MKASHWAVGLAAILGILTQSDANGNAYDVSADFSITSNPAGPWSYGWASALDGSFTLLPIVHTGPSQNGVPVTFWAKNTYEPAVVYINNSSQTSTSDNGQGTFPPGTVWFYAGVEGHPDNYGVIRFIAPSNGTYRLDATVRSMLDGDRAGDTDFHILKNGTEIFGQFLAARAGTSYTNTALALAAGDRVDFAIGRGQDGILYGSGLKLQARLDPSGDGPPPPPPPPPPPASFDISRDFSTNGNPGGPWSYGYVSTLGGTFSLYGLGRFSYGDDPTLPAFSWSKNSFQPGAVYYNPNSETLISNGGQGVYPPKTVYFFAGEPGTGDNFAVIRLTLPTGAAGTYRLESAVRSHLQGPISGDTDIHILKNGGQIFEHFLPPRSGVGYTNEIILAAGDTVDFAVGRGEDGLLYGSGLIIDARLVRTDEEPTGVTLSGLLEFSTDSDGDFYNGSVWNTRGGDTAVNLWVIRGSDPQGAFINGPSDARAGISIELSEGEHTFTIFGNRGGPTPHHGLNLFFNGNNTTPRISVFGPTQVSPHPFPQFAANDSSHTLTLAFQPAAGAGTLVFEEGGTRVELTDYRWADPSVYDIDRVSQPVATPDGTTDFIGQFTLRVRKDGGPPPPPPHCAPVTSGLIAWWRGEGNANDSVGSNHGQTYGGVSFAPGKVGRGFRLDGVDDFILIPDNATLDLVGEITMEMWFNSETWGENRTWALMDKRTWNDCNYGVVVSQLWGFQLYYNDPRVFGGDHPGNMFEISSHYPLPTTDEFHHFAGTYRQVDANHVELTTYLDGAMVRTRVFSGNLANTVNDMALAIGTARGGADGGAFRGIIDEVSLYNRALSDDEVRAIYRAGRTGKCLDVPPTIVVQPRSREAVAGSSVTFSVSATGTPPLAYQWLFNGDEIPGATGSSLTLPAVQAGNAGRYSVRVSNAEGSVTSAEATLRIISSPPSGITLSGLAEFSTDAAGNFYNGSIWSTHNDPYWIVKAWVIHSANLQGPFVNGPSASQANISIPLSEGEHTFVFFANQGGFTPHHGLNLFFNGDNVTPRISVFGATQTSSNSVPAFSANGGNTVTIANASVPGANSLVFEDTTTRVELVAYRFANITVHNLNRVSQLSTTPDGGADFIGQFTLRVTRVGEPPPPGDCAPISRAGLVAWWRGEGNANDSVGSNHGQLLGGTTFAPGKVGQGFRFDGVNDFVLVPDSAALDLTGEITMEMWFNSQTWGEGRTWAFMDKRTWDDCNYGAVVSEPWGFQLYYNDPNVWGGDHPGNMFEISSYYPLPSLNVFHHFAGTFRQVDASHIELKTYLDGALVQTRLFSGNLANTVNDMPLAIASARGGAGGGAFRGVIDEISLYNRVLSADEVQAIYHAGSAGKCVPTGGNTPPLPHIAVSPRFDIEGAPRALVIACDGTSGEIVLDARGSTDPDGDALTYAWFATGSPVPFSSAAVVTIPVDAGLHSVTLRVSDGQLSANTTLAFEVIAPAEAAAYLSLLLDAADLPRKHLHPLQAALQGVIESLEDGKINGAIGQLGAFDNKVKAQLVSTHPEIAERLSTAAQALIEALEHCMERPDSP